MTINTTSVLGLMAAMLSVVFVEDGIAVSA